MQKIMAIFLFLFTATNLCAALPPGHHRKMAVPPFFAGMNFSNPQIASIEAGFIWRLDKYGEKGIRMGIEPGIMGFKSNLGFGLQALTQIGGLAAALNASYLYTWHKPWMADPRIHYLGPEIRLNGFIFVIKSGYYWALEDSTDRLFSFSFGMGFL